MLKNKGAYFVKKTMGVVAKIDVNVQIIYGDLATKPIEQLAILVDEVIYVIFSENIVVER